LLLSSLLLLGPQVVSSLRIFQLKFCVHFSFCSHLPTAAVLQLRPIFVGFPRRWPGFDPRSGLAGYMVD
jgi:hypothetical protein